MAKKGKHKQERQHNQKGRRVESKLSLARAEKLVQELSGKKRRTTKHHLNPRSRGGGSDKDNIKFVDELVHVMWHVLFGNLLSSEVIDRIKRWTDQDGKLKEKRVGKTRLLAWGIVFKTALPDEAIKIVENEWVNRKDRR